MQTMKLHDRPIKKRKVRESSPFNVSPDQGKTKKLKVGKNIPSSKHLRASTDDFINRRSNKTPKKQRKKITEDDTLEDYYREFQPEELHVIKNKIDFDKFEKDSIAQQKEFEKITIKEKDECKDGSKAAQKKVKQQRIQERQENSLPAKHPELEERTIFVGNINVDSNRRKVKSFFSKYGQVETVRFRGITPKDSSVNKKQAITTKKMHPGRKTIIAYVRFESQVSKENALEANGLLFGGLHIRVDNAIQSTRKENSSVFVGNLDYEANDEDLRSFFKGCGTITNVRVIRCNETGRGKGIGFVSFDSMEALEMALLFTGKVMRQRALRIRRVTEQDTDKSKQFDPPSQHKGKFRKTKLQKQGTKKRGKQFITKERGSEERTENFSGIKAVKDGKAIKKKKKPRKTKTELKKIAIAKQLANTK